MLGILAFYAGFIDDNGRVPLLLIFFAAITMGFLQPKGSWRWVILIGAGVDLANISGHLIDSSPIPAQYQLTLSKLMRDIVPALIGTYAGIFSRRYLFNSGDLSYEESQYLKLNEIEVNLTSLEENNLLVPFEAPSMSPTNKIVLYDSHPDSSQDNITDNKVELISEAQLAKVNEEEEVEKTSTGQGENSKKRDEALKRLESRLGLK